MAVQAPSATGTGNSFQPFNAVTSQARSGHFPNGSAGVNSNSAPISQLNSTPSQPADARDALIAKLKLELAAAHKAKVTPIRVEPLRDNVSDFRTEDEMNLFGEDFLGSEEQVNAGPTQSLMANDGTNPLLNHEIVLQAQLEAQIQQGDALFNQGKSNAQGSDISKNTATTKTKAGSKGKATSKKTAGVSNGQKQVTATTKTKAGPKAKPVPKKTTKVSSGQKKVSPKAASKDGTNPKNSPPKRPMAATAVTVAPKNMQDRNYIWCNHCKTILDLSEASKQSVSQYLKPSASFTLSHLLPTSDCAGMCGKRASELKMGLRYCIECTHSFDAAVDIDSAGKCTASLKWICDPCWNTQKYAMGTTKRVRRAKQK